MGKSGSGSWGSLLLSPGSWCTQGFVCALQVSVSPVLCKFWRLLMVGLMATSSKRACAIPRSAVPRAPAPCSRPLLTRTSVGDTQTLKGRSSSVSVGFPGAHNVLFEPSESLWWVWGLILNAILPLLPSCWGFSFALACGVSFFGGIQHSPVDGCSAVSCNFGVLQEKMSACPCTLPSWICQKLICSIYKRNLSLPKHRKFTSKLKVCQFFSKNIKDRIKLFCLRLIQ